MTPDSYERYASAAHNIGALSLAGLLIGMGQLLASTEKLTWRLACGRAIVSAGLGASSAAVLAWLPSLPFEAQLGLACALASLGTSSLERILQRILGTTAIK